VTDWWLQWWLGLALLVSGYSMARMGPAFRRSKLGAPLFLVGLLLTIYPPDGLLVAESRASDEMLATLEWLAPALVGFILVASGAPIYYVTNKTRLILGWALVLFAGYSIFVNRPLEADSIILGISALLGILITVILHLLAVRFTESLSSGDGVTEPLDEDEIKHVSAILSSHLSQMEGPADE
tara:strand:- start:27379 stop:27927 length:549 start_codon:yes stop_codon:yes gene_type:complete